MSIFFKKMVSNEFQEEPKKNETSETAEQIDITETIGSRISQARKAKGYTQEQFSQMLDIQLLPKIAEILDMTTDELLTGKKGKHKEANPNADIDTSNLKVNINVTKPNQNPVNVSLPLSMIKKFAKIGNGISGIIGNGAIDSIKFDEILTLIENGATGEILNVVSEDNTNVSITIK